MEVWRIRDSGDDELLAASEFVAVSESASDCWLEAALLFGDVKEYEFMSESSEEYGEEDAHCDEDDSDDDGRRSRYDSSHSGYGTSPCTSR